MKPREITVISGKGGTGKTSLAAALASVSPEKTVLCDADVDAPDLEILLHPRKISEHPFMGMQTALVDAGRCVGCGKCRNVCRFGAIGMHSGKAIIGTTFCEGCSACTLVCPQKCISIEETRQGTWFAGQTDFGPMVHARLDPGGENSGMLVQLVRREAHLAAEQTGARIILTDGPPGIACPA
ncbi:MAG: 4Fe-4S binding protein, partial [Thermovirgaceae bacterium]|nr:4Fe-4S binding protein [Thermovirgaceae bacterium]